MVLAVLRPRSKLTLSSRVRTDNVTLAGYLPSTAQLIALWLEVLRPSKARLKFICVFGGMRHVPFISLSAAPG